MRGTVRSTKNKEKTADLVALGDALPGTLTLYEADLLKDGSFDESVEGSDFVIHTASPFLVADENTDPHVNSPLNCLSHGHTDALQALRAGTMSRRGIPPHQEHSCHFARLLMFVDGVVELELIQMDSHSFY